MCSAKYLTPSVLRAGTRAFNLLTSAGSESVETQRCSQDEWRWPGVLA